MILAEQAVAWSANPFLNYGALGVVSFLLAGWLTWLGRWVIAKFTDMISNTNGVIQRNTDVVDSWKRQSGEQIKELTKALNGLRSSSQECREDVKQIVQQALASQGD